MSAIEDIAAERRRQIEVEGWALEHDDEYRNGELAKAAAAYAGIAGAHSSVPVSMDVYRTADRPPVWPWAMTWWKPTTPRRDLVKAAALIVAEIERLDRASTRTGETK